MESVFYNIERNQKTRGYLLRFIREKNLTKDK